LHLLEQMIGEKFATKHRTDAIHRVSPKRPKPVPINAIHCNGQRGATLIEDDPRRSNKLMLQDYNATMIQCIRMYNARLKHLKLWHQHPANIQAFRQEHPANIEALKHCNIEAFFP